jgi:hypothetical protein
MPATPKKEDAAKPKAEEKKEAAAEKPAAPAEEAPAEAAPEGEKPKAKAGKVDLDIPDDTYQTWQMYRSRHQIYASVLDHDAKVEGKAGKAGDFIAYDPDKGDGGEYYLLKADEFPNYAAIAPSERVKQP